MTLILQKTSFRLAEQVLNSKLSIKEECESILTHDSIDINNLTNPVFNSILEKNFISCGWEPQPKVFPDDGPDAKMDFKKDRVGMEVQFGHSSFIGIDLLKLQISSYSELDQIDVGIYVTVTSNFIKKMKELDNKWTGSLNYEKVVKYIPHFKSAIQVPILVYGIDVR